MWGKFYNEVHWFYCSENKEIINLSWCLIVCSTKLYLISSKQPANKPKEKHGCIESFFHQKYKLVQLVLFFGGPHQYNNTYVEFNSQQLFFFLETNKRNAQVHTETILQMNHQQKVKCLPGSSNHTLERKDREKNVSHSQIHSTNVSSSIRPIQSWDVTRFSTARQVWKWHLHEFQTAHQHPM